MLRKAYVERCMVTGGWISLDPADMGLIEAVYKKTLREGEERLMLAVLESAVEDFQKLRPCMEAKRKKAISRGGGVVSRER
jgi:hypothetical protein